MNRSPDILPHFKHDATARIRQLLRGKQIAIDFVFLSTNIKRGCSPVSARRLSSFSFISELLLLLLLKKKIKETLSHQRRCRGTEQN